MRIYEDSNGLLVNAISSLSDGTDVQGHQYMVITEKNTTWIDFQRGAVPANGVNGVTNEALLAILIHRTKFLDAKFPCDQNKSAIEHMQHALDEFNHRTNSRIVRGVEGLEVV